MDEPPTPRRRLKRWAPTPVQLIALSFLSVVTVGWLLLMLPICGRERPLAPIDALFLSTTSVCVTGLVTVNLGAAVSDVGHLVVLLLVQVGGLGYMVLSTAFVLMSATRMPIARRLILRDALGGDSLAMVPRLWRAVIGFTALVELTGAAILTLHFVVHYGLPWGQASWLGLFHAVSAFCNAGLDIFGLPAHGHWFGAPETMNSIVAFAGDPLVLVTLATLIVLGGIGFVVVLDVVEWRRPRQLAAHTKIVLWTTGLLIVLGALGFWIIEHQNRYTLGGLSGPDQLWNALFQSITTRTAGFASIDQAHLHVASKLYTSLLMFIGASPAGTGGGIKTTTFVIILLASFASVRGNQDLHIFRRRITHTTVYRALAVGLAGAVIALGATFLLSVTEQGGLAGSAGDAGRILDLFYEACSAFGTVGLSTGLTPSVTVGGKLVLIATMLAGRIGPVTIATALLARFRPRHWQYPEGHVLIG